MALAVPATACVAPGDCSPPPAINKRVAPLRPRQQWNINGGFCGAMSIQETALAFGSYISQDLVRKANTHGEGHGSPSLGYEVLPSNIAETAQNLRLKHEAFDYNQTKPQSPAYLRWLKKNLAMGYPVVWFVMCKGDGDHVPYPGSNPNGGHFDHIEPVWGIGSNKSLADDTVYGQDWLVHGSDQDLSPYYRSFDSLVDTPAMQGNCKNAQAGVGKNEMYPCLDDQVNYGLAVKGLDVQGSLPVSIKVSIQKEPDVRVGMRPVDVTAVVTVSGLQKGQVYKIFRYTSTASLPKGPTFAGTSYDAVYSFTATGATYQYSDPKSFKSNTAIYYLAQ